MLPNIGAPELIIILVIALIVVGPGKLPDVGAALGKSIREFRKASTDIQDAIKRRRRYVAAPGRPLRRRPPRRSLRAHRQLPAAAPRSPRRRRSRRCRASRVRRAGRRCHDLGLVDSRQLAAGLALTAHGRRRRRARAGRHRSVRVDTRSRARRRPLRPATRR